MRAIYIFLLFGLFVLSGCATVQVAKEVTKATKSIETSVKKILKSPDDIEKEKEVETQKTQILEEKSNETEIIIEQKKIITTDLLGVEIKELTKRIGNPNLIREDGEMIVVRFDTSKCRLFIFINSNSKNQASEYFELRNTQGQIIERKKNIENCYKELFNS
ncbi:MAG: hypothetical protein CFH19_00187 [Alphaproteobacteria bacterium MarineAlpha5_Bin9]|nr:MAG: hypothetical protein CFH19_00187 [Alphaproteobacteria bacterium MarineAlpha5_Bin9]|tara:strand:- start:19038 stop:19523 length:486 start_codon:yes stop_codon:yes gene_type:complete